MWQYSVKVIIVKDGETIHPTPPESQSAKDMNDAMEKFAPYIRETEQAAAKLGFEIESVKFTCEGH